MIIKGSGSYHFNFEIEVGMDRAEFDILSIKEQDQVIKDHLYPTNIRIYDTEIDEDVEF